MAKKKRITPHKFMREAYRADILKLIIQHIPFRIIAENRNKSVSSIYRLFSRMKEEGLATPKKNLTKKGSDYLKKIVVSNDVKKFSVDKNIDRLHDLQFTIKILRKPKDWEKRRQAVTKFEMKTWNAKNTLFTEFYIEDFTIRTTPNSILVFFEDIYNHSPIDAGKMAFKMLERLIPKIENLFKIKLGLVETTSIKVGKQHHALILNEIAKQFLDWNKGRKKSEIMPLKIYDENGELRTIVDNSMHLNELEFVHKIKSESDAQKMKDWISDIVLNDAPLPSQTKLRLIELEKVADEQGKLNFLLGENLKKAQENLLFLNENIIEISKKINNMGSDGKRNL